METAALLLQSGFDLHKYIDGAARLDLTGIDLDRVPVWPLAPEEITCLEYMMDIETHTALYMGDLLNTPARFDPAVTAFLMKWGFEEYWHGEAFAAFLAAAGHVRPAEANPAKLPSRPRRTEKVRTSVGNRRLRRLAIAAASFFVDDFVAVHMAWGAINELTTLTAYQLLAGKTEHPLLVELLKRIVKQERVHYAFYYQMARIHLADRPRAQRTTARTLKRFWTPVGVGVKSFEELDPLVSYLFTDEAGARATAYIDREISALPGLAGFAPIAQTVTGTLARNLGQG